jgi:hypothetical protein
MACCLTLTTSSGVTRRDVRTLPTDPDTIRAYKGDAVHALLLQFFRYGEEEVRLAGVASQVVVGLRFEDTFRVKGGGPVVVTRGTAACESSALFMSLLDTSLLTFSPGPTKEASPSS